MTMCPLSPQARIPLSVITEQNIYWIQLVSVITVSSGLPNPWVPLIKMFLESKIRECRCPELPNQIHFGINLAFLLRVMVRPNAAGNSQNILVRLDGIRIASVLFQRDQQRDARKIFRTCFPNFTFYHPRSAYLQQPSSGASQQGPCTREHPQICAVSMFKIQFAKWCPFHTRTNQIPGHMKLASEPPIRILGI